MNSKDRKAEEAKTRRWLSAMDGDCGGYVTCSCGSARVTAHSHLDVDGKRVIAVTYICSECRHHITVFHRRGQLELVQRLVDEVGSEDTPDYIKDFLKQQGEGQ